MSSSPPKVRPTDWEDTESSGLFDLRKLISIEDEQLARDRPEQAHHPELIADASASLTLPTGDPEARRLSMDLQRANRTNRHRLKRAMRDRQVLRGTLQLSLLVAVVASVVHGAEVFFGDMPVALKLVAAASGALVPFAALVLFAQERYRHASTRRRRLERTIQEFENLRGTLMEANPEVVEVVRRRAMEVIRVLQPEHEDW